MNLQVKSSLILIFTLIIGIVLGMLIDRTIMRNQFQRKIVRLRHPDRLFIHFERIIRPTESQRKVIHEVLDKYAQRLAEIGDKSRTELVAVADSLQQELMPLLTDEQRVRLKEHFERMRDWRRDGPPFERPGRRPPPPPEPWDEKPEP